MSFCCVKNQSQYDFDGLVCMYLQTQKKYLYNTSNGLRRVLFRCYSFFRYI